MRNVYYVVVLVVILLANNCTTEDQQAQPESRDITVGITSSFIGEAAIFVAKEKGFFKENGLNVTLKHNQSGTASIHDLFDNVVDIAHVAETPVVYSLVDSSYYKKGNPPPFQIITNLLITDEIQKIVARKDHGISRPKDVVGKKIALAKGTQLEYYLDSFLLEHQISKDSLTLIDLSSEAQIEALRKGRVDVSVNWEPYATFSEKQLGPKSTLLKTKLHFSTLWLVSTLDSFAQSNPKVLIAYLKALHRANQYIEKHAEETRKILAANIEVPVSVIEAVWQKIDYKLSMSERMIQLFEDQERWLIKKGRADTTDLNYLDIINKGPLKEVHPEGVILIE
ncbi:ABC transporter substrate-binding protein [Fodinibius halophilus]|uniref:ABC transporter substrate-binding protein n=1 Tax=Fodinibius halophilus TaxID=1736908 RepID=A0A6M1T6G2_9BACT|nr:ABC transporter substrate-binding protein [Fodinibius halophilus]NGP87611.1 ABC transporter substrate-binding protein [Fodinibius halophilus]